MGIRIDALDPVVAASRSHAVPAMKDDATVKLAVGQIIDLVIDGAPANLDTLNKLAAAIGDDPAFAATLATALDTKAALLSAGTSDNTLTDTDELAYVTGAVQKRGTLAGLVSSIFTTARTIANGQFAAATFKLFNAAGTPRALTFNTTALTADRSVTLPDANVDLSVVPTLPFTKAYVSTPQTITSAGALTLTHGLGAFPKVIVLELVCLTAEFGYTVNTPITIYPSGLSTGNTGCTIVTSATAIFVKFGSNASVFAVNHNSTGANAALTNTNWALTVRAYA